MRLTSSERSPAACTVIALALAFFGSFDARAEDAGSRPRARSASSGRNAGPADRILDAGPGPDAGPGSEAGPGSDAGLEADASELEAPPSKEDLDALRIRLRRLDSVASAAASAARLDVPLESLFVVDLTDEEAVADRLTVIDERLERLKTRLPELGRVETSSTSTAAGQHPPAIVRAALEAKTLNQERAFLLLDKSARLSRLEADEARRIHEREQEEAKARAREARVEAANAEAARLQALQEAERARTKSLRALKSKLASVERAKSELAERERLLAERQEASSREKADALRRVQELLDRSAHAEEPAATLILFGEISSELKAAADVLRQSLTSLEKDVLIAEPDGSDVRESDLSSPEERLAAQELTTALKKFERAIGEFRIRQREFRLQSVEAAFRRASALADARAEVLARVSGADRSSLLGLSQKSLDAARLEAELLALGIRSQPILQAEMIQRAPRYLKDAMTLGMTFWVVTKVVFVMAFAFWIRRRGPPLRTWFHTQVRPKVRSVLWLRRLAFLERNVEAYGSYLIFLATIHLIHWALGPFGRPVAIDLLFTTVLWVSYYWLLRTWLNQAVLWLARMRRVRLNSELRAKLERSTTLVGRTFLVYGLLQSVAVKILRPGVLYHFARLALLAGVLAVVVILIRWWRRAIAHAYLDQWREGRLARLVESTQDKPYNLVVVAAALVYVLVSGTITFTKQFLLGFEQYRKALAFLFRKRLERRSEGLGTWTEDIGELPERVQSAFTLEAVTDPALKLDYFPGLDKFERDFAAWRESRQKGSFLLRSSRGYGKTTWLHHALGRLTDIGGTYIRLERHDGSRATFIAHMHAMLGIRPSNGEALYENVVEHLLGGERRLLAVDDIHHLFFRRMGGCDALDALMDLIEDTGNHVFWLCAVDSWAWRHILAARPTRIRFRAEYVLPNWSDERVRELLMLRSARSAVTHEFVDLVVAGDSDEPEEALKQASEGYIRLIWDYADGCPLVALRFWLHSLTPVGPYRVKVRLFKRPDEERLERIPEEGIFIYAAVANHGALTPAEASSISGYPEPICEAGLIRGAEEGYLTRSDQSGRFALTVDWQRQMIRFLRARQAL